MNHPRDTEAGPVRAPAPTGYPLAGIRVVALEQAVAAPLCTRHLADLGAEVIKIERPDGGDFARHYDTAVSGLSANFVWLNRGKKSVVLDLKSDAGREALRGLLRSSDVFVHNLGPGAVERLGFGYEAVAADNPGLVWCGVSGYGSDGPYRDRKGFDLLLQGEAGILAVTGTSEQPSKVGISIGDNAAGVYAFAAILAVLYERRATGQGRRIDISLFDCLAEWMSFPALLAAGGRAPGRSGARHATIVPYGPYRCGDGGLVNLAVQNDGQWRRLCAAVCREGWIGDHRFATNESRARHRAILEPALEEALAGFTLEEAVALLDAADVPCGRVNQLEEFLEHPQLRERDRWLEASSPAGPVPALAHPLNIADLPRRPGRVPALGEHTGAVLASLEGPTHHGQNGSSSSRDSTDCSIT